MDFIKTSFNQKIEGTFLEFIVVYKIPGKRIRLALRYLNGLILHFILFFFLFCLNVSSGENDPGFLPSFPDKPPLASIEVLPPKWLL